MNHHQQSHRTIEIDTRLVWAGAALTATGTALACAGMAVGAFALLTAGRRMIREMDVPPAQQAAAKLYQAKEASRAGLRAWQAASDTHDGLPAR